MKLNIMHLYPDLLNLYGDTGNIECLKRRSMWRGIDVEIRQHTADDEVLDLDDVDIVFFGGGSDREERLVASKLIPQRERILKYVNDNKVLVAVCGGFQLLGKSCVLNGETIEGLSILDVCTEDAGDRLIGDVVVESDIIKSRLVGFENHGGKTDIGSHKSLGKVIHGGGNNGNDKTEGVIYKNVIATYLHGPLFPKNPELCDYVITKALENKYSDFKGLEKLDDSLEAAANDFIVKRYA